MDRPLQGLSHLSLETSCELKDLFVRYPQLRAQLRDVYVATNEPLDSTYENTHERSGFGRGSNRGRRGGSPRERGKPGPWSQQKGLRLGLRQLQKLKEFEGTGEGLKAFSNLVTSTVDESNVAPAGTEANERLQQEAGAATTNWLP